MGDDGMSAGAFGLGFSQAMGGWLQQQRERQRQAEDQELDMHMKLIENMANRPDFNPAMMGSAIEGLTQLAKAKGGQSKLKGGGAGFMGAHDLPMTQFLQGIHDNTRPIQGPTFTEGTSSTGAFPTTSQGGFGAENLPGQVGPSASALPAAPLPMAPAGASQAPVTTRTAVPQAQQPYLRAPGEALQEQLEGKKRALLAAGATPDQAKMAILESQGLKVPPAKMGTPQAFEIAEADGTKTTIYAQPEMGVDGEIHWKTQYGQDLPPNARPVAKPSAAGAGAMKTFKTADGTLFQLNSDHTATPITGPGGQPLKGAVPAGSWKIEIGHDSVTGAEIHRVVDPSGVSHPMTYVDTPMGAAPGAPPQAGAGVPPPPIAGAPPQAGAPPAGAAPVAAGPPADLQTSPKPDPNAKPGDFWKLPTGEIAQLQKNNRWMEYKPPVGAAAIPPPPAAGAAAIPAPPAGGAQVPPDVIGTDKDPAAVAAAAQGKSIFVPGKPVKLNQDQQKMVDSTQAAIPLIEWMEYAFTKKFGNRPHPHDYPNDWSSKLKTGAQSFGYDLGFLPSDEFQELAQAVTSLVQVVEVQKYLHGVRNFNYIAQIQAHMPNLDAVHADTPANFASKLYGLKRNANGVMAALHQPIPFPNVPYEPPKYQELDFRQQ